MISFLLEKELEMVYYEGLLLELWLDKDRSRWIDSFSARMFIIVLLVPKDKFRLIDLTILDEKDCTIYLSYIRDGIDYFVFHIRDKIVYNSNDLIISDPK